EGQSYRIGKITTHSEVEGVVADEFAAVEKIKSGETYSPNLIDNNTQRLENLALKKSLNFIAVEPKLTKNAADGTVDVDFVIKRGPKVFVERIDIQGNTTTMDQVIRRQFRTVEGDPFSPSEVRKAAERIKALGFFADSSVDTKPGTTPDQVIVDVNVTEQPTGTLSVGASYGVSSGFGVTLGFSEENFLGRGQYLSANISKGTSTTDSGVTFAEPNFLGRDVKLKFAATYNQTNSDYSNYDTKTIAIVPALEFPLTDLTRLEIRYKIGANDLYAVDSGSSALIVSEAALGTQTETGPGYSLTYDSRINGLNPKGGILLKLNQDYYGLGGDVKMISTTGLAMAETKVGKEDTTLRAIFEGGFLLSSGGYDTRLTDRFFGRGKIRGFEPNGIGPRDTAATNDDAVGGNYFAAVRLESEFPIGLPEEYGVLGGLFFDAGSVWGLDNTTGTGTIDDSFHLRSAAGFSILWTTPIGPLRLNFSKALLKESYDKEQNFDLTIQTKF
ncbi:MAG: outer membrane protein assembly factor BamA, partial [Rhodobacteraceae bacterium]|nr:outer membrane protein assembly factor BamA [Paracoccaceae bacterium]